MTDDRIEEQERTVLQLGEDWFTFKDDIKPEDLGAFQKTLTFNLGYADEFIVDVHENGVMMTYTPTGARKYSKSLTRAMSIAAQLQQRSKTLYTMVGGMFGE